MNCAAQCSAAWGPGGASSGVAMDGRATGTCEKMPCLNCSRAAVVEVGIGNDEEDEVDVGIVEYEGVIEAMGRLKAVVVFEMDEMWDPIRSGCKSMKRNRFAFQPVLARSRTIASRQSLSRVCW